MKRTLNKLIICVAICLFLFSIDNVYATFQFADLPIDPVRTEMFFEADPFDYPPEEVLPGGSGTAASIGENHLKLVKNLLDQKDYGLNATKKPILHNLLNKTGDQVFSDQQVTTGQLKFLMPSFSSDTEKLYFVITWISDSEYHAYTLLDADRYLPIGTEVFTYKTVLKIDDSGEWVASVSYEGYAPVIDPDNESVHRAVDVFSWRSV